MMDSRETAGLTGTAATTTGDTLLDVRHLSVDYQADAGDVHAVTDVSFTLKRGEILGLAGESGSGKSTLAYAITCLLRPPASITGGEILYYPHTSQAQNGNSRVTFTRLAERGKRGQVKGWKE